MPDLCCRDGTAQLESELSSLTQLESSLRKQLEQKEKRLQAVQANIEELKQSIQEHQEELATELHNHLSAAERQELADLTPRLKQLQVRHSCLSQCWAGRHHCVESVQQGHVSRFSLGLSAHCYQRRRGPRGQKQYLFGYPLDRHSCK